MGCAVLVGYGWRSKASLQSDFESIIPDKPYMDMWPWYQHGNTGKAEVCGSLALRSMGL